MILGLYNTPFARLNRASSSRSAADEDAQEDFLTKQDILYDDDRRVSINSKV